MQPKGFAYYYKGEACRTKASKQECNAALDLIVLGDVRKLMDGVTEKRHDGGGECWFDL